MDQPIPEDLEAQIVELMGENIPQVGTPQFRRFLSRLKHLDRGLAGELKACLEGIQADPPPLVSPQSEDPLEAERRRVAFREGLKDSWRRIFQQENLSGDQVPRRRRWVMAGVVLFGLALAATVFLYRSKPVQDLNVSTSGGLARVIGPPVPTTPGIESVSPSASSTNPGSSNPEKLPALTASPQGQANLAASSSQSFTGRGSTSPSFSPTPQVEPIRPEPIRYSPQRVAVQNPTPLPMPASPAAIGPAGKAVPRASPSQAKPEVAPALSAMAATNEAGRLPMIAMAPPSESPDLAVAVIPSPTEPAANPVSVAATSDKGAGVTEAKTMNKEVAVVAQKETESIPIQASKAQSPEVKITEASTDLPLSSFPEDEAEPLAVGGEFEQVFTTVAQGNRAQAGEGAVGDGNEALKSEVAGAREPVGGSREVEGGPIAENPQAPSQPDVGMGASRTLSYGLQSERTATGEGPVVVMRVKPAAATSSFPSNQVAIPSQGSPKATPNSPANPPLVNSPSLSLVGTPSLPPVTGPAIQGKSSLTSPYTLGQRLEGKLGYDIVLAEGMGGFEVVVETSDGMLWKGTATLDATKRVSIRFAEAFGGVGGLFAVQAMALDMNDAPGLAPTFDDKAPSLASDMVRASINGLSTFVQNLANATTTTVTPGGGVSQERQAPPLGWTLLGEVSKLFALPADKSFVRIARVPKGTPMMVLYGVGGSGR